MADYRTAVLITLDPDHEGGYVNNPNDPGGETNHGITQKDVPGMDVKTITIDFAIAFYQHRYWKAFYSQIFSQLIANKLFDMGVLFGVQTTVKMLQEVLQITADGDFGPDSLARVNSKVESVVLQAFKTRLVQHALGVGAAHPSERYAVAGWIRRINS